MGDQENFASSEQVPRKGVMERHKKLPMNSPHQEFSPSHLTQIRARLVLIPNCLNLLCANSPSPARSGVVPKARGQKPAQEMLTAERPRLQGVIDIIFSSWIRRNCFKGLASTKRMVSERPSSQEQVLEEKFPLVSCIRVTVNQQLLWHYHEGVWAARSSFKGTKHTIKLDLF